MGTRGAFGVRVDGTDKIVYNHFDSYASGLGADIVGWLHEADLDDVRVKAKALRAVEGEPTDEERAHFAQYADSKVSDGKGWYSLLRKTQGDLGAVLEAGVYEDNLKFLNDSLFCEYAYVVNLDDMIFEVYKGFQRIPSDLELLADPTGEELKKKGRYWVEFVRNPPPAPEHRKKWEYAAVALVGTFPIGNIPLDWDKQCFGKNEDEE